MIPVTITCEAEAGEAGAAGGATWLPVLRVNGDTVWRGRPVGSPDEAEGVALGYLRYALGGALLGTGPGGQGPADPEGEATEGPAGERPLGDSLEEVVEGLRREVADGVQRIQDFIERGEWRRFLP